MLAYGFASGLPLSLSGFTFRLWLSDSRVGLTTIGLTAWIGLAYSLKFLWAPLLDQAPPVSWLRRFGRRRGWLLLVQPCLAAAVAALAVSSPRDAPILAFCAACCLAVLSATQDIAIDAWRIETFPERRQGLALALYVWGYRFALPVATSGVIWASSRVGWNLAFGSMAAIVVLSIGVTLAANDPDPGTTRPPSGLRAAVIEPIWSFLQRPSSVLVLCFVALFKLGEAIAGIMTAPFYQHLGFNKDAIGATALFSLAATLAGITLGGWLVARIGVGRALLLTGWVQTAAMAMYVLLSVSAGNHTVLFGTVTIEAFAQGLADADFLTFLSNLCDRTFAATQYALLSSIPMFAIHTIGGASGIMAASLGWTRFYIVCMGAAFPGMTLMMALLHRQRQALSHPI
jgi:MFS transporter, PAT family, beta-lactamase induction signal transducer AmpG